MLARAVLLIAGMGIAGTALGENNLVQTKDWLIATNGKYGAVATVAKAKGSWSGFVPLRGRPNDIVYRIGGEAIPWSGLQLYVNPASGVSQLIREWKIDTTTGIPTFRDFLAAETLPGITYLPATLPDNGDWIVLPKRVFLIDSHNYKNEAGEVFDGVTQFTDQIQARYAGIKSISGLGRVEIIEKRDYYGGTYEEYWLGRLEDGTVLGIVRWIAPGWSRDEQSEAIVAFENKVAFKCLVPWAGGWSDSWLWPEGTTTTWVPEPPQSHVFRTLGGGSIPVPPIPPPPAPPPTPTPTPQPGYGEDIVIKSVDLDRILAEEAQRFIEELRTALLAR